MNIVHVVRQFHPGIGGLENFVDQLSLRQAALGHNIRVITLDRIFDDPDGVKLPANEQRGDVEIRRVPFVGSRRFPIAPTILALIKQADIVHVHAIDFFCDYLAATAVLHRKPMVLSTHGGFFHTGFASAVKKLYFASITRSSLSQYGAVIACSAEDERIFRPITGSKLVLIPNPVDIDKFAGLACPTGRTIIYFGRLAPNKRVERLIDWFALLAERDSRWQLIIAGKPMGVDVASLVARVSSRGLESRIEIHESPSDDAMGRLIGRSSVYACASSYEGFGLAAVEAVSSGLFPVLSTIPPFQDTLKRLGYGLAVDFESSATWAQSHEDLERELDQFRVQYDAAGVRASVEPFDWSAAAPAFIDVYEKVLGRTQRRIGTVNVDVMSTTTACGMILDAMRSRRSMMVAFCNAHTANLAHRDAGLRDALDGALVLNDGVGLDIASKSLFGAPFPENLNGTDFVPHLLGSIDEPVRLFLLGGKSGVAEAAAAKIGRSHQNVQVVGTMNGYFDKDKEPDVLRAVQESDANLVLVAMGQPRQEMWARRYFREINGPVLCVGALLDFIGDRVRRAPTVTRNFRLEWAFRLAQEPRRLARRYLLGNVVFLSRILRQRLTGTRI